MQTPTPLLCALLLASGCVAPAFAAESYDSCTGFIDTLPTVLSTQGTWCLRQDLSSSIPFGPAVRLLANNITIDCNGFKIGNLTAGSDTQAVGIYGDRLRNITVRNCNLRGFYIGIDMASSVPGVVGGGHAILDNRLDLNTYAGMNIAGQGSLIRGNQILDTSGSDLVTTSLGIRAREGVDVIDNTIAGITPAGADAWSYGINVINNSGSVRGNRIRALGASGMGYPVGILAQAEGPASVISRPNLRDNHITNPAGGVGTATSIGIWCTFDPQFPTLARAKGNTVSGFAFGNLDCGDGGDNDIDLTP